MKNNLALLNCFQPKDIYDLLEAIQSKVQKAVKIVMGVEDATE